MVEKAGFCVLHGSYFFSAIFPLLLLRHFIEPDDRSPVSKEEMGEREIRINPFLNSLLFRLCRLENKLDQWVSKVPGGSIILVAEKNDTIQ